jgi:predicted permease
VSLADARLQLTTIGQRLAAAYPRSHEHVQPRVLPYAKRFFADFRAGSMQVGRVFRLVQIIIGLLLLVVATNVAVLVYARTANRAGELAVRTALGASRRRIVMQLFAEALVLSGFASAIAIVIAYFVFRRVDEMIRQSASNLLPYWMRLEITPSVVVYVAGLAIFAAIIIGVIPGLKATRDRVSENLKDLSGASMRLGRTWTALLIAQVAASVAALPFALSGTRMLMSLALLDVGTPGIKSLVIATPTSDDLQRRAFTNREDARMARVRYTNHIDELVRRLETEAGFNVFRMSSSPGREKSTQQIEIERSATDSVGNTAPRWSVGIGQVDARYFLAFNLAVLAGRSFTAGDFASGAPGVIVNRSFVQWYLGGGNALGRRLRPDPEVSATSASANARREPWREIVGVVEDLLVPGEDGPGRARVYLPLRDDGVYPMTLAVRGTTAAAVSDRVRKTAMSVDPTLRFATIQSLDEMFNNGVKWDRLGILWIVMVMLSVILLSAAGIYALMSFTVTRRQREIGIRSALGAPRRRVLAEVLSRAMRQIGIGIAIGIPGGGIVYRLAGESDAFRVTFLLQPAAMMVIVGLIATIGPARRALRVQPTEALRTD